jgi:pimeloyl-ACP methyl ester carboxylesterase
MGVMPALVRHHRVIAPDLPGHGASEVIDGPLDIARVLAWLGELIEQTCASPPALVGQLLSRLVLVDTFGLCEFQPEPEFGRALTRFLARPSEPTHRELWRHCAFDLDGLRERMGALWAPFEAYNLDRARTPGVQKALAALMPSRPRDAAGDRGGRKRPLRLAAARDRECQRRPAGRAARGAAACAARRARRD